MSYLSAITGHTIAFYWMGINQGTTVIIAFLSLAGTVFYLGVFWVLAGVVITAEALLEIYYEKQKLKNKQFISEDEER